MASNLVKYSLVHKYEAANPVIAKYMITEIEELTVNPIVGELSLIYSPKLFKALGILLICVKLTPTIILVSQSLTSTKLSLCAIDAPLLVSSLWF